MSPFSDVKKIEKKQPPVEELLAAAKQKKQKKEEQARPKQISWDTPEYILYKKTADWYWSLGIISTALVGIAIWQQNFLFALIALIGGFAVALYAVRIPRIIHITISIKGVEIDDRVYPYETLSSFWIFYRPGGTKELSLLSEKIFMPRIAIPLGNADPNEIRDLLIEFMPEKVQEESLTDVIARRLGF